MIQSIEPLQKLAALPPWAPPQPAHTIHTSPLFDILPKGSFTSPLGFMAVGDHVGIKKKKKDLAILYSGSPAVVAGVFTQSTVKAAPVIWSQGLLNQKLPIHAVVVNSGNANACTGPDGFIHTQQMAAQVAEGLFLSPVEVMVASTGVIGVPLPIDTITQGISALCPKIMNTPEAGLSAAEAILTTDTFPKHIAVKFLLAGQWVTIGGMAKGSGMIHPNMATMLGFISTDANIPQDVLQYALSQSVEASYNMISVDGDTSTNDMVLAMANGLADNPAIEDIHSPEYEQFYQALHWVNVYLAKAIAQDGEGATKLLTVAVHHADTMAQAKALAKGVITSNLVKTAIFGADANWGRFLAAMGATGVAFNPDQVTIALLSNGGPFVLFQNGTPVPFDEDQAKAILSQHEVTLHIDLGAEGQEAATAWGCDLTYDYVKINGDYRS